MVGGTADVKQHEWFSAMNFEDLYLKRVSKYAIVLRTNKTSLGTAKKNLSRVQSRREFSKF